MLKGYADAYKALQNKKYLETAIQNAEFILKKLWSPEGNLWHSYKNNQSSINGFLEDYATVIDAFISLYEVTFNEKWLQHAKHLTDYSLDHFYDETTSFFTFKSNLDDALITTHYETEDNVIPASNSMMAKNLFQLSVYFNHTFYEKISSQMIHKIIPNIDYPSAFSNWLDAFLNLSNQNKELAICGKEALLFGTTFNKQYKPNVVLAGTKESSALPFLANRFADEKNLFYVCQNKTCDLPKTDFDLAIKDLTT
jgi:uncharacterized protein YyaL (SSP411 family)